jgi:Ca-activated chloride channel homolog
MHGQWIFGSLLLLTLVVCSGRAGAQTNSSPAQNLATYGFKVSVDEVDLTFHAVDAHGLPVNDLKLNELSIFDNEKPQSKILAFYSVPNEPIRAEFLWIQASRWRSTFPKTEA